MDYETQHIPSRIVVLIWWLFAITIMTSFTASLTASFTTSKPEGSVNTLVELADSSKHIAIIFKDSSADAYFKVKKIYIKFNFLLISHFFRLLMMKYTEKFIKKL